MTAPYSVIPGDTPGTPPGSSADRAGDITLSGNLVLNGGVIELGAVAAAPLPLPGTLQIYTLDGVNSASVGAGGNPVGTTTGNLTVTGVATIGTLVLQSSHATQPVLQVINNSTNTGTGSVELVENAPASRSFSIRVNGDANARLLSDASGNLSWGNGTAGTDTAMGRTAAGVLSVTTGSFSVTTAGSGLAVKEGSNAKQGTAVLVAGSSVVANTSVTATSRIFLTSQADGGTPGWLRVSTRTAGTSFTITSSSNTDTSTVAYEIFETA